jgi:hypothetical protein
MVENTEYLETKLIEWLAENTQMPTPPTDLYVALWSTNPANAPDSTNEITGDSYSVQSVSTSGGWVRDVTGGPTRDENDSVVDFGVLDSSTQKSVEGVVIFDGADTSTANALMYDDDISETVAAGNEFRFPAGDFNLEQD